MEDPRLARGSSLASKHSRVLSGPIQLTFDITNKCNFRCLHCFNRSGDNSITARELSDAEVRRIISEIADLRPLNLCFCGGEPLLRKEILCTAARILAARKCRVSMVTNGSLLSPELAVRLNDSGVRSVQVSLDGATESTHQRLRPHPDSFGGAIRAIRALRQARMQDISVAFTPTSFNCHEFPEVYRLCCNECVTNVRVQPLMLLGRALEHQDIEPSPLQYRRLVKQIQAYQMCDGPRVEWGDPIDHLIRYRTLLDCCLSFVGIRADGTISVSPYLPITVGCLRNHTLPEYWNAGLPTVWTRGSIKNMAANLMSVYDMGRTHDGLPQVWVDEDFAVDLVENQL